MNTKQGRASENINITGKTFNQNITRELIKILQEKYSIQRKPRTEQVQNLNKFVPPFPPPYA